jgi:hypothetical protein
VMSAVEPKERRETEGRTCRCLTCGGVGAEAGALRVLPLEGVGLHEARVSPRGSPSPALKNKIAKCHNGELSSFSRKGRPQKTSPFDVSQSLHRLSRSTALGSHPCVALSSVNEGNCSWFWLFFKCRNSCSGLFTLSLLPLSPFSGGSCRDG